MEIADIGDQEEREVVAEYLNQELKEMNGNMFAFWNHRPNQEVENYDDLIQYFKLYAKIAAKVKVCTVLVTADYKDNRWLYDNDKEYVINEEEADDNHQWFQELELKRKINEGEEAKKILKDFKEKTNEEVGSD